MLQEINTSRDVEITSPLSEVFVGRVETRIGEPERSFGEKPIKTRPLSVYYLLAIMQTENVSNRYQPPKFETETVLTEENFKKFEKTQISGIIDKILDEDKEGLLKGIDKHKVLETILKMVSDISLEWNEISDEEFFERIKRILVLEAMSGILKELEPEQIRIFDEAIKRRPLFK